MNIERRSDSPASGPGPAGDAARIDALIDQARTLNRTGAAQQALAPALEAAALAEGTDDLAKSAAAAERLADAHYALSA
jgi:hypothetical protein